MNTRNYPCDHPGCDRPAYARRLCNMHYIRKREGIPMDQPVANRVRGGDRCISPGCGKKAMGLRLCKNHYRRETLRARKSELVKMLGGRCKDCSGEFPLCVFDFHHLDPSQKDMSIGVEITNRSMAELVKEAKKCDLLCANCHRVRHGQHEQHLRSSDTGNDLERDRKTNYPSERDLAASSGSD